MAPLSTTAQITRAARRLFLAQGVDGVTMRRIAEDVGISATAIYRHFRNKHALLDAITEEGFTVFRHYLEQALRKPTALSRLRALGHQYLEFAMDHPHHYALIFLTPRSNVRRYPADFATRNDLTFHILSTQVEGAMASGALRRGDPLDVALSVWAQAHGLAALHHSGRFAQDPELARFIARRSFDRMLRGLRAPERPSTVRTP